MSNTFKIMFVCTGNICRSPFGERVLAAGLDQIAPGSFEVRSAGTFAVVDYGFAPKSAALAKLYGADVEGFKPRRLTEMMVDSTDLIFALTQEHRQKIIELDPRVIKKTFTLREFIRCLDVIEIPQDFSSVDEAWKEIVKRAAAKRSLVAASAEEDDVIDPWQRSNETYQQMAQQMAPAIKRILQEQLKIAQITENL